MTRSRSGQAAASSEETVSTKWFICSIEGTRGKCLGSLGVATNAAGLLLTCPALAIHWNHDRTAAKDLATDALANPRS